MQEKATGDICIFCVKIVAINGKRDKGRIMGINTERDVEATLQIGPTSVGMVRLFVQADDIEIPFDFAPEEALEIAAEITAAANQAASVGQPKPTKKKKK